MKNPATKESARQRERRLRLVAAEVVERLFVNVAGGRAERLVLEGTHVRDMGGWCRGAVRDVVLDVLRAKGVR